MIDAVMYENRRRRGGGGRGEGRKEEEEEEKKGGKKGVKLKRYQLKYQWSGWLSW